MTLAFVVWIYIAFIGYSYGNIYILLLKKMRIVPKNESLNFFFVTMAGLAFLSSIVGLISIFYRINIEVNVILTLIAFVPIVLSPTYYFHTFLTLSKSYQQKWQMYGVGILYSICVLFLGTVGDFHADTGQYHAQAVKWTENYPTVYGLANLFGRMGYNSMFHVLSSFFSLSFLHLGSFRLLNSFFLLLLGWRVIEIWCRQARSGFQYLYLFILLMEITVFRGVLSSMATDNVVSVLIYFVFIEFIEKMRDDGTQCKPNLSFWGLLMLILLIITTKISVAPIAVLMLYLGWQSNVWKSPRALTILFAVGAFAVLPWLTRNVILSGYLIYPFPAIDIFEVDWKVPKSLSISDTYTSTNSIESDRNWIYSYALNANMEKFNWRDFIKFSFLEKYKYWLGLRPMRHFWFLSVLIFFPIAMRFFASKKSLLTTSMQAIGWVAYLGCIFLFFNAPDVRFCISFLTICSVVMLCTVIHQQIFLSNWFSSICKFSWIAFFAFWLFLSIKDYRFKKIVLHENFVFEPASYPKVNAEQYKIGNFTQYVAIIDQNLMASCWDAPLPCSDHFKTYLELRGKTLAEGFRVNWDKIRELEKLQKPTKSP
jgi:hypothetical protein